jgi:gliding motility-associated-like protein
LANGGTGHLEIRWPDYSHAEETITITPSGSGFVEAEVTDENGCPAIDSQYVQMRLLPNGQLTTDIAEGCAPVCVNFSFSQTSGDSIQNYLWSFNNQFTGSNTIEKQCFSTPGSPNVALQIIDINGCTNILHAEGLVEIHPNPVAAFSRTPFDADIVNPEFKFFNESTDAVTFRWGFGDGAVSLQENPTHTYADTGNYTVCLKVTSGFGCVDSTCDELDVDPFPTIYAPNVFTPNSDGHNEKFKVVVTYATKFRLEIYDRWGELLHVSTDPEEGWDGTYKGNAVQEDVYVWRAYVTNSMNWNKELIGRVTVVE